MLRTAFIIAATLLALSTTATAQFVVDGYALGDLDRLDATIEQYMIDEGIPNGAMAIIAADGRLVAARAYTNYDGGWGSAPPYGNKGIERTTLDSRFRIASLSKPITAAAILQLTEYGCISDVGAPVWHYVPLAGVVPWLDPVARTVTLRGLLMHTEGWYRPRSSTDSRPADPTKSDYLIQSDLGLSYLPIDHEDIILHTSLFARASLSTDFYANYGYLLLGRAIEKASGLPYEEYVRQYVLRRAGVDDAHLGHTLLADRLPGEVRYYHWELRNATSKVETSRPLRPRPYGGSFNLENRDANGGWVANPVDLVLFARDFMSYGPGNVFRDDATTTAMFQHRSKPHGYGWRLNRWRTGDRMHTGSMEGNHALLYCYPPSNADHRLDDVCVAVTFNKSRQTDAAGNANNTAMYANLVQNVIPAVRFWGASDLWDEVIGGRPPRHKLYRPPLCAQNTPSGTVQ